MKSRCGSSTLGSYYLGAALGLVALGDSGQPVDTKSNKDVENHIGPHNSEVSPRILPVREDLGQEGIGRGHRAIRACAGCIRVLNIAPSPKGK